MTSSSTDRKFGVTMAAAFALLAALRYWRRGFDDIAILLGVIAAIFFALGLVAPKSLGPVHRGWMRLAEALGWVNTRILLILIFYLVVTPLGLIMRLFRRDPLDMARRDSYWTDPPRNSYGDRHYEKQF